MAPKRRLPYTFLNGNDWHPCETPFESEESKVPLGFNYWVQNHYIFDSSISELITSTLIRHSYPKFLGSQSKSSGPLVFVAMHGLDPIYLAAHFDQCKFLRICSSVPIQHAALQGTRWPNSDISSMVSNIFWPSKPPLSISELSLLDTYSLYRNYSLVFRAENLSRHEDLSFNHDESAMSQVLSRIPKEASLEYTTTETVSVGRFRQINGFDTGVYILNDLSRVSSASAIQPSDVFINNMKTTSEKDDMDDNSSKNVNATAQECCFQLILLWAKRPVEILITNPDFKGEVTNGDYSGNVEETVSQPTSDGFSKILTFYPKLTKSLGDSKSTTNTTTNNNNNSNSSDNRKDQLDLSIQSLTLTKAIPTARSEASQIQPDHEESRDTRTEKSTAGNGHYVKRSDANEGLEETTLYGHLSGDHIDQEEVNGEVFIREDSNNDKNKGSSPSDDDDDVDGNIDNGNSNHMDRGIQSSDQRATVDAETVHRIQSAYQRLLHLTSTAQTIPLTEERAIDVTDMDVSGGKDWESGVTIDASPEEARLGASEDEGGREGGEAVSLQSLLLSGALRDVLGYPSDIDAEEGTGFVSTSGYRWRPPPTHPQSTTSFTAPSIVTNGTTTHQPTSPSPDVTVTAQDLEEGEEGEEGELEEGTGTSPDSNEDSLLSICALDCEMVFTKKGLELARLSLASPERENLVVLDMLVKPSNEVVDYNTAYSGITAKTLENVKNNMSDALRALRRYICSSTILIGHSLECDLRCLGLVHHRVIDTSLLFPHPRGAPFKHGLKTLAKRFLGQTIQQDADSGHDSVQDAVVCLELVLLKALRGHLFGVPRPFDGIDTVPRQPLLLHSVQALCDDHLEGNIVTPQVVSDVKFSWNFIVHSCQPLATCPEWERFAFGYRSETDPTVASDQSLWATPNHPILRKTLANNPIGTVSYNYASPWSALEGAIEDVESLSNDQTVVWMDVPFVPLPSSLSSLDLLSSLPHTSHKSDRLENTSLSALRSMADIDKFLSTVFEAMPSNAVIAVLTQGNITDVWKLIIRKQRLRWEEASTQKVAGSSAPTPWTDEDEDELSKASIHALYGAAFFRKKI